MPTPQSNEPKDDFISRCMAYPDMQDYPSDQRYAICVSKYGKEAFKMRHQDFTRIYNEFTNYYKTLGKGESEYYSWVHALNLDESKPYGSARESFKWAKSMLNYLKEDAENKYYGVIVGLPWRSMNGNVYRERDLIAAALSLKGKHPSLNHKDEFWFNEQSRWGTLTVEDAKYEEGAIEAVLKVPKTTVCPICNGAKMTELIDKQHIVNVSLEGSMNGAFEFTDPPFTLLTSDVLPGIPLARIKPLETIMESIMGTKTPGSKNRMKIKAVVTEDFKANTTVNTNTFKDDSFRGNPVGPTDADSKIDVQNDLAKTVLGTPAASDNLNMNVAKAESKVSEPFAGYTDFADCVAKNSDKSNPQAYCGTIQTQAGEKLKEEDTSQPKPEDIRSGPSKNKAPDRGIPEGGSLPSTKSGAYATSLHNTVVGTAPVEQLSSELLTEQVERIKAETREATAHDETENLKETMKKVETIWASKYTILNEEAHKQQAYNLSQETILKEQRETIRKEQLRSEDLRVEMRDLKNQFADATSISNKYGRLVEDLKLENADLNKKYQSVLQVDLELSKKLTCANEEYLELAQQKETIEEKLTKARTNAKKTLKLRI